MDFKKKDNQMQGNNKYYHIAVCICTRERPVMLERIIRSYAELCHPPGVAVTLVIIENDRLPACREKVLELADKLDITLHYCHESRLGIPYARNRALDEAESMAATHLAFADDDEWFQPDWLIAFWHCRHTLAEEAVLHGPVVSVLPDGLPDYYAQFYYTGRYPTGTRLNKCATNNVLIPLALVLSHGLRFDESRPLSGGEDTRFFQQANQNGILMIACEEAYIYEEVTPSRVKISWLVRRNYRIGATWGNYQREVLNRNAFLAAGSQLPKLIWRTSKLIFYFITLQKKEGVRHLLITSRTVGRLVGCFGFQINDYEKIDT